MASSSKARPCKGCSEAETLRNRVAELEKAISTADAITAKEREFSEFLQERYELLKKEHLALAEQFDKVLDHGIPQDIEENIPPAAVPAGPATRAGEADVGHDAEHDSVLRAGRDDQPLRGGLRERDGLEAGDSRQRGASIKVFRPGARGQGARGPMVRPHDDDTARRLRRHHPGD